MQHLRMPHRSSSIAVECCRCRGAWNCGGRYTLTTCVESAHVDVRFPGVWWLIWMVFFNMFNCPLPWSDTSNLFLSLRLWIWATFHEQICLCTGHPVCWHSVLQYTAFLSLQKHHRASACRWQMQHAWMTSWSSSIEWTNRDDWYSDSYLGIDPVLWFEPKSFWYREWMRTL